MRADASSRQLMAAHGRSREITGDHLQGRGERHRPLVADAIAAEAERREHRIGREHARHVACPLRSDPIGPQVECRARHELRGDTGRSGEVWGRYGRVPCTTRAAASPVGRYGEIWGDTGSYGGIRGGLGRSGEVWGRYGEAPGDRTCGITRQSASASMAPQPSPRQSRRSTDGAATSKSCRAGEKAREGPRRSRKGS